MDERRKVFEAKYGKRASAELWTGFCDGWDARPETKLSGERVGAVPQELKEEATEAIFAEFEKDGWPGQYWFMEEILEPFLVSAFILGQCAHRAPAPQSPVVPSTCANCDSTLPKVLTCEYCGHDHDIRLPVVPGVEELWKVFADAVKAGKKDLLTLHRLGPEVDVSAHFAALGIKAIHAHLLANGYHELNVVLGEDDLGEIIRKVVSCEFPTQPKRIDSLTEILTRSIRVHVLNKARERQIMPEPSAGLLAKWAHNGEYTELDKEAEAFAAKFKSAPDAAARGYYVGWKLALATIGKEQ